MTRHPVTAWTTDRGIQSVHSGIILLVYTLLLTLMAGLLFLLG